MVAPRIFEAFDARMKFVAPLSWPPAAENPQGRYGVGTQLFGRLKLASRQPRRTPRPSSSRSATSTRDHHS